MKIIKRNGAEATFDISKIIMAITKANAAVEECDRMSPRQIQRIAESVELSCQSLGRAPTVEEIQDFVEHQIMAHGAFEVAKRYITYRYNRSLVRKSNTTDDKILSLIECNNEEAKQENSNKNPVVNSTQRDYMAGEVSRDLTNRLLLPEDIVKAHEEGIIHFHDTDYYAQHMHNCDLVNLEDMLQNGTVITGTLIERPHSFATACNIATQIVAQVASNQYGGQSISLTHLAPFVDVSRQKIRKQVLAEVEALGVDPTEDKITEIVEKRLREEIRRGVQTIQYQVVTLLTTNGQAPFITVFMYLTDHYDVVVRYQGGGNAGHTVVNEKGKFALHLLPSGIFRDGVVNILGNGVALDCENLLKEMETLRAAGVIITPENLKVSDRASLLLPWHRELDALEEARLADKKYGSTKQGIAPFYGDKYQKKTVQAGELLHPEHLKEHLADLLEWKNLTLQKIYGAKGYTMDELMAWVDTYCGAIKPYITDTGRFLRNAQKEGKSILFEAQLGALRDLDYGIYPYTTSSNAVAAYAPVGSGLPTAKLDEVVGVVKAYSSCVGEGPFVCEWFGEGAQQLRDAGAEYGAKTGRPRRVGPIDLVATRYGVETQGATNIALTKLDVLSYMDKIPVCAHYELNGEQTDDFPFPVLLQDAKPVVEYLPGWQCDISGARKWEDLPEAARSYVEYVEKAIGCHIGFVSVGAERESLIIR